MQASVRVMACCYIRGEAAGTAAALSGLGGTTPREQPVGELQEKLRENGAYLPYPAGKDQ